MSTTEQNGYGQCYSKMDSGSTRLPGNDMDFDSNGHTGSEDMMTKASGSATDKSCQMKKSVGLFSGTTLIVGTMIGTCVYLNSTHAIHARVCNVAYTIGW